MNNHKPFFSITQNFLETKLLSSPFENMSEADFMSYLYQKSLEIEPKEPKTGKPPSFVSFMQIFLNYV